MDANCHSHHVLTLVLGNKLFLAPVKPDIEVCIVLLHSCIDMGYADTSDVLESTGCGNWHRYEERLLLMLLRIQAKQTTTVTGIWAM